MLWAVPRSIAVVAYEGVQVLDVTGPLEVFAAADRERAPRAPAYRGEILAPRAGPLRSQSGIRLVADRGLAAAREPFDTLIVAGGDAAGIRAAAGEGGVVSWLRRAAPRARRLASVCSGAFLLAEAGLLDGRRATTHWNACGLLAQRYPRVRVESDPIFVRDGRVYTSAGVTAGMDLALALVEADLGRELALAVARRLVLFLKRPGGQSQFSAQLAAQIAQREPLRDLQAFVLEHPDEDLSVEALARRAAMSPRHFARVFAAEVGTPPGRWVERARVEAARRLLEESSAGVAAIAAACGFGSAETMRRAFLRCVRVGPASYRSRFSRTEVRA
jgi:transcriptional regulator GlxA family with amidase domain